jgi:hypothetical protein
VLTVNGTGFLTGAVVTWNGLALTTTYISASQLLAVVTPALMAAVGNSNVTVMNPGNVGSNAATFTISPPETGVIFSNFASGPCSGGLYGVDCYPGSLISFGNALPTGQLCNASYENDLETG